MHYLIKRDDDQAYILETGTIEEVSNKLNQEVEKGEETEIFILSQSGLERLYEIKDDCLQQKVFN